ncbi:AMP-binding protein [Streptomyces sp. NPDC048275]|uniref:AMP-binding protein n=1 Tax=Streptomyces sp. NPDC048275 TaxID=3155629 RepID=UPI0033CC0935
MFIGTPGCFDFFGFFDLYGDRIRIAHRRTACSEDDRVEPPACVFTHAELAERADAAVRLLDLGIAAGDRIVVQLGNGWEFVVLTLACLPACLPAGVVPVIRGFCLSARTRADEAPAPAVGVEWLEWTEAYTARIDPLGFAATDSAASPGQSRSSA